MRIFENLFKKSKGTKTEQEKNKLDKNDIRNYKIIGLNKSEIEHINNNSQYLADIMPLYLSNMNKSHIFHPDNLKEFSKQWFKQDKEVRLIQVKESEMLELLGIGIGNYVKDTYGLYWSNAAFMQPDKNRNIALEMAIVDQAYQFLFLPLTTFSDEIYKKDGSLEKELNRISNNFKPIVIDKNNLSFEELVSAVKKNGTGESVLKIWEQVFDLDKWHFVTAYKDNIQESSPFIGVINERPWLFMFTSLKKAKEFGSNDNRFQGPNGECLVISQTIESSMKTFKKLEKNGVFGLMVNINDDKINADFNIPFSVLDKIKELIGKGQ